MELELLKFNPTNNIVNDVIFIVEESQKSAYRAVDYYLVIRNWMLGYRLSLEKTSYDRKNTYGKEIINNLSKQLTASYGKGFDLTNLYRCISFYKCFPNILDSVSQNSLLSWTHYRYLLTVEDKNARDWYAKEAYEQTWSVRTLQRNIYSQYYFRLLKTHSLEKIEIKKENELVSRLEYIKNPLIAEFLEISQDAIINETKLENAIINHLQKFIMELGKGYAFVARQQHIHTTHEDYFIDLVFYNYILKCFVLIDLKTKKITHQDVGQMDMYIRMYDELKKSVDDNPTLGIVLCSETDEDIAKYSILKGNEQLFASKYKLYIPEERLLKEEIEKQKQFFFLQHKDAQNE